MRVLMLQNHNESYSHKEHGALSLEYGAGSTQHFDDTTAQRLIGEKKAVESPEANERVQMLRTVTEVEVAELVNAARARNGVLARVAASPGTESQYYPKGALVHFPHETAQALIGAVDVNGNPAPAAKDAPDEEYEPAQATRDEAIERAVSRRLEEKAASERREQINSKAAVAKRAPAGSGQAAPAPSTSPSTSSTTAPSAGAEG